MCSCRSQYRTGVEHVRELAFRDRAENGHRRVSTRSTPTSRLSPAIGERPSRPRCQVESARWWTRQGRAVGRGPTWSPRPAPRRGRPAPRAPPPRRRPPDRAGCRARAAPGRVFREEGGIRRARRQRGRPSLKPTRRSDGMSGATATFDSVCPPPHPLSTAYSTRPSPPDSPPLDPAYAVDSPTGVLRSSGTSLDAPMW